MAFYVPKEFDERTEIVYPEKPPKLATPLPPERHDPVKLLFRRILDDSFHVACQVGPDGLPTEQAEEAMSFIETKTDWTAIPLAERLRRWGCPAPPAELRREHYLSFDFCARALDLDPEQVRRDGLPKPVCIAHPHDLGTRPRNCAHVAGIEGIIRARAEAQARHQAKLERARKLYGERACPECGSAFLAMNATMRFCGKRCRERARIQRQNAPGCCAESVDDSHVTAQPEYAPAGKETPFQGYLAFCAAVEVEPMTQPQWKVLGY